MFIKAEEYTINTDNIIYIQHHDDEGISIYFNCENKSVALEIRTGNGISRRA